jgi:hypothetical protein
LQRPQKLKQHPQTKEPGVQAPLTQSCFSVACSKIPAFQDAGTLLSYISGTCVNSFSKKIS